MLLRLFYGFKKIQINGVMKKLQTFTLIQMRLYGKLLLLVDEEK